MSSRWWRFTCGLLALASLPLTSRVLKGQGQGRDARTALRIVVLQGTPSSATTALLDGFRRRLEQLGRPVELVVVNTDRDGIEPVDARRAGGATGDLILALGSRAAALAATAYRGVPIIGALVARESAVPDGGVAALVVLEFAQEVELEWMRRILPNARRVGVLYSTDENARLVARARDVAKAFGMEIVARRVTGPAEIPAALDALSSSADVLWGIPDDIVLTPETAKAVLLASLRSRVPFVGLSSAWVRAGAVYALDRDFADLGAQTADVAIRVLDGGASLRTIGVVRPRTVRYSLNGRSAEMMRLTMSPELMRGATEVVR